VNGGPLTHNTPHHHHLYLVQPLQEVRENPPSSPSFSIKKKKKKRGALSTLS